jgi:hypothetical protein
MTGGASTAPAVTMESMNQMTYDPTTPYLLPPRSVLSFSGGRTSGYMLKQTVDAFGGKLPDDRRVVFCNTGKEREETLAFVERCSLEWDVPITWLEYRWEPGRNYFVEVNYATASRKGEPFELLIKARKMLPNPVMRTCTIELKLKTTNRYVRQSLGWDEYTNAVGFRHDEPKRVATLTQPAKHMVTVETLFGPVEEEEGKDYLPGESPVTPLNDAKATRPMILDWWKQQPFDLELADGESNCSLCFLKGAAIIVDLMRKHPDDAAWWIEQEQKVLRKGKPGFATFRSDRPSYAELSAIAKGEQEGPGWLWADKDNGSCGEIACRCTD